jgi:hypothetical protein
VHVSWCCGEVVHCNEQPASMCAACGIILVARQHACELVYARGVMHEHCGGSLLHCPSCGVDATVQVVEAVWQTQANICDVPAQLLPTLPDSSRTAPRFQLVPNIRRVWHGAALRPRSVAISLSLTFQRPGRQQLARLRQEAALLKQRAADALSLRSMFAMQLKVRLRHWHVHLGWRSPGAAAVQRSVALR